MKIEGTDTYLLSSMNVEDALVIEEVSQKRLRFGESTNAIDSVWLMRGIVNSILSGRKLEDAFFPDLIRKATAQRGHIGTVSISG